MIEEMRIALRNAGKVVNNVETFATVPVVVDKGPEWFGSIGASKYPGTKIFSLSGDIVKKGCFEVPTDTSLRDIIYGLGGGIPNGRKLKAVQIGGSSCGYLKPDQLDTPVDFESMRLIGSALGSGDILVIDDSHDMVDMLAEIAHFFNHKSCGKCAPCREGTYRVAQLMDRIATDQGTPADLEMIKELSELMNMSCYCPLGQSATTAIVSAMEFFRDDFKLRLKKEA